MIVYCNKNGGQEQMKSDSLMNIAFQTMLDNSKDMVFVKNANMVYEAASIPFVKMVGKKTADEIIGYTDLEIFDDENLARRYMADDHMLVKNGKNLIDYIEPLTDDDGKARYGSTSKYLLYDSEGVFAGILGITRDITRDYIARQHYQQELSYLFELPSDTYAVSYIDVDSWRIISQRRQNICDGTLQACHSVEKLCEAALESIVDKKCMAAEFYSDFSSDILKNIYESGRSSLSFEYQRYMSDGSVRWVHNDIRFLIDADSGHLCAMLSAKDIDAEKREEQQLVVAAKMDKMTMLYNRETTMESIRSILKNEADGSHVLFMIDVDNFKTLNDTMGHQAGDKFLIALAAVLKKNFRESDIVGRVGGDEFFAFMRNVSDISKIEMKAKELLSAIQSICISYPGVKLSGSIGISIYPEHGRLLEEIYSKADEALYQAKRKGKNQYVLF